VKFDRNRIIERKDWFDDEPRYVGAPNTNNIDLYLVKDFNIKLNTRIISLKQDDKW